jgi:DNA-binding NarL/FixJ family response regulator
LALAVYLVVVLSFHDSQAVRLGAWTAGADGFASRSETMSVLIPPVGDLLRRRANGVRQQGSVFPRRPVPLADISN